MAGRHVGRTTTVIVEFRVEGDQFTLGRVLAAPPDTYIELERIIPSGPAIVPYVWARGTDLSRFERRARAHERVADFVTLDRIDDWALYRIEWTDPTESLLSGIDAAGGAVLEARRDDEWLFRLRFPDHDALSSFYSYCREQEISIDIARSYTASERSDVGGRFDLSRPQREALVLALREGYFDTPSRVSLADLATEFDISEQALSNRIRRGTKNVLQQALA